MPTVLMVLAKIAAVVPLKTKVFEIKVMAS